MASRPTCVLPGEPNWASGVNNSPSASNSWSSIENAYRASSSAISARASRRATRRSRDSSVITPARCASAADVPELEEVGTLAGDADIVALRVLHQGVDVLRRQQLGRQRRVEDRYALELAGQRVHLAVGDDRQRIGRPDVLLAVLQAREVRGVRGQAADLQVVDTGRGQRRIDAGGQVTEVEDQPVGTRGPGDRGDYGLRGGRADGGALLRGRSDRAGRVPRLDRSVE